MWRQCCCQSAQASWGRLFFFGANCFEKAGDGLWLNGWFGGMGERLQKRGPDFFPVGWAEVQDIQLDKCLQIVPGRQPFVPLKVGEHAVGVAQHFCELSLSQFGAFAVVAQQLAKRGRVHFWIDCWVYWKLAGNEAYYNLRVSAKIWPGCRKYRSVVLLICSRRRMGHRAQCFCSIAVLFAGGGGCCCPMLKTSG